MFIQSHVADIGLRRRYGAIGSLAIWTRPISWRVKIVAVIFLGAMLLNLSVIAAARTSVMPEIAAPPKEYLPGNLLPQLPKNAGFVEHAYVYQQCVVQLADQTVYVNYLSSHLIAHTAIRAQEYNIGDLIIAWGQPTGIYRWRVLIIVYWGTCEAILYTDSFRPESQVKFIEYDLDEQVALPWQGFKTLKMFGNS